MSILPDQRGVSEVLGAILVFALVLSVLVIVQVAGVPAANKQIEFEHNNRVQADFQAFDQNVDRAASLGAEGSSSLESGVRYPPRLFLINPGPAAGTVTTSAPSAVGISNVAAVNAETNEFFTEIPTEYTTTSLRYSPSYNEYGNAPTTTYEHGVIFNSDGNGAAVVADGNLVSGNRISLTVLDGSLSESSTKTVPLSTTPISAPAQTVSITNAGSGNPLTLKLSTQLSQVDWWDENNKTGIMADEMPHNDGKVEDVVVDESADTVTITFKEGVVYSLRLAKVGIGTDFAEEEAYYMTDVSGSNIAIDAGGSGEVSVQVRDRFNNPVSGVEVTFKSPDGEFAGGSSGTITVTSNEDGIARAVFEPDEGFSGPATVTAEPKDGDLLGDDNSDLNSYEKVPFSGLTVSPAGDTVIDDTGENINPHDRDGSLILSGVARTNTTFALTFSNNGDEDLKITDARLNFYYRATPANNPASSNGPKSAVIGSTSMLVRGPFEDIDDITVGAGESKDVVVEFYKDASATSPYTNTNNDDFFIMSTLVDGGSAIYFAAPGPSPVEPDAAFTYTPSAPKRFDTVQFDGAESNDADGTIQSYAWDFDYDGTTDATGKTASHQFSTAGDYDVVLTVTDSDGLTDSVTKEVTVTEGVTAVATANPTSVDPGEEVTFSGSSSTSDSAITSYEWDFDGSGTVDDTGETVTHSFASEGSYTVELTVTNADGQSDTDSVVVTVGDSPSIDTFDVTDNSETKGNPTDKAIFDIDWAVSDADGDLDTVTVTVENLDDGSLATQTYTGASGSETYTGPNGSGGDTYEISIEAVDDEGNTATDSVTEVADGTTGS